MNSCKAPGGPDRPGAVGIDGAGTTSVTVEWVGVVPARLEAVSVIW